MGYSFRDWLLYTYGSVGVASSRVAIFYFRGERFHLFRRRTYLLGLLG